MRGVAASTAQLASELRVRWPRAARGVRSRVFLLRLRHVNHARRNGESFPMSLGSVLAQAAGTGRFIAGYGPRTGDPQIKVDRCLYFCVTFGSP